MDDFDTTAKVVYNNTQRKMICRFKTNLLVFFQYFGFSPGVYYHWLSTVVNCSPTFLLFPSNAFLFLPGFRLLLSIRGPPFGLVLSRTFIHGCCFFKRYVVVLPASKTSLVLEPSRLSCLQMRMTQHLRVPWTSHLHPARVFVALPSPSRLLLTCREVVSAMATNLSSQKMTADVCTCSSPRTAHVVLK